MNQWALRLEQLMEITEDFSKICNEVQLDECVDCQATSLLLCSATSEPSYESQLTLNRHEIYIFIKNQS